MFAKVVNTVVDCEGYFHRILVTESGQYIIDVNKDGKNVSTRIASKQEAETYLMLVKEMSKDISGSKKEEPVKVTRTTIPVKENPVNALMSLFSPQPPEEIVPPKKDEIIIHTPRGQNSINEEILNEITASKLIVTNALCQITAAIKRIEKLEKTVKGRMN